uniref:Uncharacterized protein n=1 Tax=Rhizophora mucronata TaxID=61149 RepID=A0A2P2MZ42_RHIMU
MDHSCRRHASVADILDMNQQDEVIQVGDCSAAVGSSSKHSAYANKSHRRPRRVLNCVLGPDTFKRPFSRGRVLLTRQRTVHETSSPV